MKEYRMFLRNMFYLITLARLYKNYIIFGMIGIYSVYIFIVKGFLFILAWKISFLDSASPFMESLVDLYYVVWYILIFILVGIIYLLSKIMYYFTWNMSFSKMFNINLKVMLALYLSMVIYIGQKNPIKDDVKPSIIRVLSNLNAVLNKIPILNFFYNNKKKFLAIQGVGEYKKLEVIWCGMPSMALAYISAPTFGLIYSLDPYNDPGVTLKAIGRQWYWHYEYNVSLKVNYNDPLYKYSDRAILWTDFVEKHDLYNSNKGNMVAFPSYSEWEKVFNAMLKVKSVIHYDYEYDSVLQTEGDLKVGEKRLLVAKPAIVLPVGVPIKILVTSEDVLHSWTIPNLGIKVDAVPGRINQFVFEIKHIGTFWGQCSELCGTNHGFMPITLHAVHEQDFVIWIRQNATLVTTENR